MVLARMESSRANLPSMDTDVEPARFKCQAEVDLTVSESCACLFRMKFDRFCWTGFKRVEYVSAFFKLCRST